MRKTMALASALAVCLVAVSGCHKEDDAPAVARIEAQPRTLRLRYPELTLLHLTWTPLASLGDGTPSTPPTVFVHLLDGKGGVARTFDHTFPQAWVEGTPVSYDLKLYQSAIADALPAGQYRLSVGLYAKGGKRWPLEGLGKPIGRREYLAGVVEAQTSSDAPRFVFSPNWLPVEAGTDSQVVARRWLSEENGTISLEDVRGPGVVWMMVRIPVAVDANEKLALNGGGANVPKVLVRGSCGGVEIEVSGTGANEIEMPVGGPGEGGACRISFIPNFRLVSTAVPQQRSISLESIAWIPGKAAASPTAEAAPAAAAASASAATVAGGNAASDPPAKAAPSTPGAKP
jgi:hypothetical protein